MRRFFVWIRGAPIHLDNYDEVLALRTVLSETPDEAVRSALDAVPRELAADLGKGAIANTVFEPYRLEEAAWYNWRKRTSNFLLRGQSDDPLRESL